MSRYTKHDNSATTKYVWASFKVIGLIALVALATVIIFYASRFQPPLSSNHGTWGQFGDFFGGTLNPIFGLLSLIAILMTLYVQSEELRHSSSALRDQSTHLEKQAFENTFFAMLNLYRNGVSNIELEGEFVERGAKAVSKLWKMLEGEFEAVEVINSKKKGVSTDSIVREAYEIFYSKNRKHIGHSMRVLEQLFEFIKKNTNTDENNQYWKIIRAQMSEYELAFLLYHCICNGTKFFGRNELIEHNFFGTLSSKDLLKETHSNYLVKDVTEND